MRNIYIYSYSSCAKKFVSVHARVSVFYKLRSKNFRKNHKPDILGLVNKVDL